MTSPAATDRLAVKRLRVSARGDAVRSLQEQGATWVSLDPLPGLPCGAEIITRRLPDLGLQTGTVWGNRHECGPHQVARGDDDFSFHVNLAGRSIVTGRGRELTLDAGDAVLLTYGETRSVTRPGLVRHLVVRIPRTSLKLLVRDVDDAIMRRFPSGAGALNLLVSYVRALMDDTAADSPHIARLALAHICDLIAVTLGAAREASGVAGGRGLRAARLCAVKGDIEAHLPQPELSASGVARRLRISESYVRKLFEDEDTSFSEFVLARRLAIAQRMLCDRQRADQTIASIAFECGFGDLSYFNRTFKRAYGATPSEVRASAKHGRR